MAAIAVTRITPQNPVAIMVSDANGPDLQELFARLSAPGVTAGYSTTSSTSAQHADLWRIIIQSINNPEGQVAYPGEWILVTDAAYDAGADLGSRWTVQNTAQVSVYGVSSGLPGTALDFVNTFTANTPVVWAATTTAPVAASQSGLTATLVFDQPTSADGPWTYAATQTDTGDSSTSAAVLDGDPVISNGQVTVKIKSLTEGHGYTFTPSVTTQYSGVTATGLPSNAVPAIT